MKGGSGGAVKGRMREQAGSKRRKEGGEGSDRWQEGKAACPFSLFSSLSFHNTTHTIPPHRIRILFNKQHTIHIIFTHHDLYVTYSLTFVSSIDLSSHELGSGIMGKLENM